MTQRSGGGRFIRRQNALIWLGLAIGGAGFGLGAATNPSALASLWTDESWTWLAVLAIAAQPVTGINLLLPPTAATSRAADLARLPDGAQILLSANHVCDARTAIRAQINWLGLDGSIMRTDATQSACVDTPSRASVRAAKPKGAQTAYFYFANDGGANARLYDERAMALAKP